MSQVFDTIVIGGGLAGLSCARYLCDQGVSCRLLEAREEVGGRIRTDQVDGFLLDRGFQVFLTAYPEAQQLLDYEQLRLQRFEPGALVRLGDAWERFTDPWRRPRQLWATALSPVGTLADKWKIARFRRQTTRGDLAEILARPAQPTWELLRSRGFSDTIIERFFRPFLGGVFLDSGLETSSRMCEFVFRMFALGEATLPAGGMAEIPRQLAAALPSDVVQTGSPVEALTGRTVRLHSGECLEGRTVVVATEAPAARRLWGETAAAPGRRVLNLYYAAAEAPLAEPILVLNGEGPGPMQQGPINNLSVPSQVAAGYAPAGQALISVTVLESQAGAGVFSGGSGAQQPGSDSVSRERERKLESVQQRVRAQLQDWFGPSVATWRHVRTYAIPYALPKMPANATGPVSQPAARGAGQFVCGDYCDTASINGAMASGRRAAEAVWQSLAGA